MMHEEIITNILLGIILIEIAIGGHIFSKSISAFTSGSKDKKKV